MKNVNQNGTSYLRNILGPAVIKLFFICLFLCLSVFITLESAQAWINSNTLLARAEPDECYAGIGVDYPSGPPCPSGSVEKVNQAYVWGLTQEGDNLWFGTGANVECGTVGAVLGDILCKTEFLGLCAPYETNSYVCEFGHSQIARENPLVTASNGDWRPPKIYQYILSTGELIDRTPNDPMIDLCKGIRSAGSHNGVAFLAGGSLKNTVIMFAFDAQNGDYLGAKEFTNSNTIRKWLVVKNQLYTGVLGNQAGRIMRWHGSHNDLWNFKLVGTVKGTPRELAEYIDGNGQSRIAVHAAGIWISPAIQSQGLTQSDAINWKEIWTPADYEPCDIVRLTYGAGDLHYFDGWLYFGTMHLSPGLALLVDPKILPGTWRATTIWRARNLENSNPEIQLLYGEAELLAYNKKTKWFDLVPNVGGYQPLYGSSGFGNRYNNYAWTMEVIDDHLFVGTMDCSYLTVSDPEQIAPLEFGADLWRFDSSNSPAVAEDISGLGNPLNYGIRTLIVSEDGTKLYVGMANPMNLEEEGGWELRELTSHIALQE
ncbi:MAG: hypothetical protein SWO11_03435 [Thermodesulfobacteriota bacterium]|nr:hypothetical protein [Thermodesulfobacteriota bacterium]